MSSNSSFCNEISTASSSRSTARQLAKSSISEADLFCSKESADTIKILLPESDTSDENRLKQLSAQFQEELHQKRLESLRRIVYFTRSDNWQFPPIEDLLSGSYTIGELNRNFDS